MYKGSAPLALVCRGSGQLRSTHETVPGGPLIRRIGASFNGVNRHIYFYCVLKTTLIYSGHKLISNF